MGPRSRDRGRHIAEHLGRKGGDGFNGAAVSRPRKVSVRGPKIITNAALQWGRGLATAEGGRRRPALPRVGLASMGPRSRDRGRCPLAPPPQSAS